MTDIAWRAQRYVDFSSDRSEAAALLEELVNYSNGQQDELAYYQGAFCYEEAEDPNFEEDWVQFAEESLKDCRDEMRSAEIDAAERFLSRAQE